MLRLMFNGKWLDSHNVAGDLSWLDRSNSFGDGVFETMLVCSNEISLREYHFDRLLMGIERLGLQVSERELHDDVNKYLEQLPGVTHKLKLIVSRGSSSSGYGAQHLVANRMLFAEVIENSCPTANVNTMVSSVVLSDQPLLAGIKHCNRLEQVMAKRETESLGKDEAFMCDRDGCIVEAISSNVFIFDGENLLTPHIENAGVCGVMRRYVIECAFSLGLRCEVGTLKIEQLIAATSVFLTNAISGIRFVGTCTFSDNKTVEWVKDDTLTALQEAVEKRRIC